VLYYSPAGMLYILELNNEQIERLQGTSHGVPRIDDSVLVYKCESFVGRLFTNASGGPPDWRGQYMWWLYQHADCRRIWHAMPLASLPSELREVQGQQGEHILQEGCLISEYANAVINSRSRRWRRTNYAIECGGAIRHGPTRTGRKQAGLSRCSSRQKSARILNTGECPY
jgi:hypothetical protein